MFKISLIALALLSSTGMGHAAETYSAKALFFGEDDAVVSVSTAPKSEIPPSNLALDEKSKKTTTKVAQKKPSSATRLGASYFIRLKNADGTTRDVLASRNFKSGDKFQLGVKINRPSYVYILNEDPTGNVQQIYPQPTAANNFVDAMGVIFLPSQGSFEFDNEPGVEHLLVYLSPKPIVGLLPDQIKKINPDFTTASVNPPSSACENSQLSTELPPISEGQTRGDSAKLASKAINFNPSSGACSSLTPGGGYASKAITFSEDPNPTAGGQVASYVVKESTRQNQNLYLKIKLNHQ